MVSCCHFNYTKREGNQSFKTLPGQKRAVPPDVCPGPGQLRLGGRVQGVKSREREAEERDGPQCLNLRLILH